MELARNGLFCTGLYLFDGNVCNDLDFLPSQLDDIPLSLQVSEQLKMK